jgi:hypothetical protein
MSKNVTVKVVGGMGEANGKPMAARIVDVSGSGTSLELPRPVPAGANVEIEDQHTLMLGEILRCDSQGKVFIAAVRVSETTSIADARLAAAKILPIGRG